MCYQCLRFNPTPTRNCPIAQALYNLCVKENIAAPVWECERFMSKDPAAVVAEAPARTP